MLGLHDLIARAIVLYFALVGVWGVFLGLRKRDLGAAGSFPERHNFTAQ